MATATPNGTFSARGLSKVSSVCGGRSVSKASADATCSARLPHSLLPDNQDDRHRPRHQHGGKQHRQKTSRPRNAPSAVTSFKSPAPSARTATKGSNNPNPSACAQQRELRTHPAAKKPYSAQTPTPNPGTVSQFGMRRHRQSVHPATAAKTRGQHPYSLARRTREIHGLGHAPPKVGLQSGRDVSIRIQRDRTAKAEERPKGPSSADFHTVRQASQSVPASYERSGGNRQAALAPGKRSSYNARMTYTPEPIDTSHVELSPDILRLTEQLSRNAHEVWAQERIAQGWRYGESAAIPAKSIPPSCPMNSCPSPRKSSTAIPPWER